jgi:hypothetical protein
MIVECRVCDLNGSNKLEERATEQAFRGRVKNGPAFLFIVNCKSLSRLIVQNYALGVTCEKDHPDPVRQLKY